VTPEEEREFAELAISSKVMRADSEVLEALICPPSPVIGGGAPSYGAEGEGPSMILKIMI